MTFRSIAVITPEDVTVVAAPYAPAGPIVAGTSQTENDVAIGGTYTFAMDQIGLGFTTGIRVRASATADGTQWIEGPVVDWDGTNVTITSDLSNGFGLYNSWNVGVAGEPGKKGDKGDTGATGPTGPQGIVSLDSPFFTGDPKAPTPLPGDNDNSIATTQFVTAALVNKQAYDPDLTSLSAASAVGAIYYRSAADTWGPVTIGTGLSFVSGTLSLSSATFNSPTFTGDPTAPTPPKTDSDTSLATTAFVHSVTADYAPLADPIFSGNARAPTPATTDVSETLATTRFVNNYAQPLDADLTALAAASGTNVWYYRSAAGTWAPVTIGANLLFSGGTLSATGAGGAGSVPDSAVLTGDPTCTTPPPGDNDSSVANTTWVQGELAGYARLANPSFSGSPQAPTPTNPADNTTRIATTAFVQTAIAGGAFAPLAGPVFTGDARAVTPSPGDNDTSIATTAFVQSALSASGYAPISSPAFTGTPTAPTPAAGDNDTSIATTQFCQSGFLPRTGGNLTGNLSVLADAPAIALYATPGTAAQFLSYNRTSGNARWSFVLYDGTAELGSNSGGNFAITRYSDGGTILDNPITINRATGIINLTNATTTTPAANDNSTKLATTAFVRTGLTDGVAAAAGVIGQEITYKRNDTQEVGLPSGQWIALGSIALPAGEWEISGGSHYHFRSGTITTQPTTISTVISTSTAGPANTIDADLTGPGGPWYQTGAVVRDLGAYTHICGPWTVRLTTSTTLYLLTWQNSGGAAVYATGHLRARRIR